MNSPQPTPTPEDQLRLLRHAGYSVRQIAVMMRGPSRRTIHRWCQGTAKPQRPSDIERLNVLVEGLINGRKKTT